MGGYSGGPTYVSNKVKYLEQNGWTVHVFDSTGYSNLDITIDNLKKFKENRFPELFFNPFWIRKVKRDEVMKTILEKIGVDDLVIIESNGIMLSMWGELIAQRLYAKHLVYLIGENLIISDETLFKYLKFKADRKELFSISPQAYARLFCKFEKVTDASFHHWSARISVPIEKVPSKVMDGIAKADYNIGHLGRKKAYFPSMFTEIASFARIHADKSINFILLGVDDISCELKECLPQNVFLYIIPSQQPIPQIFYDLSDVIVATAGCANISFLYGAKVISIDVINHTPLGVMGYDTLDSNLRSPENTYNKSLSETLEAVLEKGKYKYTNPLIPSARKSVGYEEQITYARNSDCVYYDMRNVKTHVSLKRLVMKLLLSIGLVHVCSVMRYRRFQ